MEITSYSSPASNPPRPTHSEENKIPTLHPPAGPRHAQFSATSWSRLLTLSARTQHSPETVAFSADALTHRDSQSGVPGSAASASPGKRLGMQILGHTADLLNQKLWGRAPAICDSDDCWGLKTTSDFSNSLLPPDLCIGQPLYLAHPSQGSCVVIETAAEMLAPQRDSP